MRDYVLALDDEQGAAPLLTVYGGKITTYRRLAEAALAASRRCSARGRHWTSRCAACRAAIFRSMASKR